MLLKHHPFLSIFKYFHNSGNTLSLGTRPTGSSRKLCVNQSKSSKTFFFIGGLRKKRPADVNCCVVTPVGEFAATTCLRCPACPKNNQALNVSSSAHFNAPCTRQISCYTCCSIVDFFPAVENLRGSKQHSCALVRILSFCPMSSFGFQLPDVI